MKQRQLERYGMVYKYPEFATKEEISETKLILSIIDRMPKEKGQVIFLAYFKNGNYTPREPTRVKTSYIEHRVKGRHCSMKEIAEQLNITVSEARKREKLAIAAIEEKINEINGKSQVYKTFEGTLYVAPGKTYDEALEEFSNGKRFFYVTDVEKITERSYKIKYDMCVDLINT
ncbi:hypothetical protein ACV7JQ_03975 [Globicatella sulfidifaciens]